MQLGNLTIPETLRDGRYTVGKLLGQGGMAVVATAHDEELGVDRAVKVLYASGGHRNSLRRRLKAEARAMARLQHPNILAIHDVGAEGELDYVVMDLAAGGSLQDKLEADGPMRTSLAIQFIIQTLSALAAAHANGVVHRDVKPHNILLDGAGRAMLADFGIALLTGDDRRTKSGIAMGSLAFMPPEQRLDAAKVGPAADIYSAGSTLFNLLTGENPVDLFLAGDGSPRWKQVPASLKPVLMKAVTMDPEERWATAGDMAYALLEVLRSDSDGFNTVEGPLEPAFPAPSQALSQHTQGTLGATLLPIEASSATVHAIEELVRVAPPAMLETHARTRTSGEPTPDDVPSVSHNTWSPTVADAPDRPVQDTEPSMLPWFAAGAVIVVLLFCAGGGYLMQAGETPQQRSRGGFTVEEARDPKVLVPDPLPVQPKVIVPAPEPVVVPTLPKPAPPRPDAPRPAKPPTILAGAWQGTMGGAFVDLQLSGSDARLRGTMKTTIASRVSVQKVQGSYDPKRKAVVLTESGTARPARFELSLEGDKLNGSVVKATGGRNPLILSRR